MDVSCSRPALLCRLMWPGSWLQVCLLWCLSVISEKVSKNASKTAYKVNEKQLREGQRNSECEVRGKKAKGGKNVFPTGGLPKNASLLCARQTESWHVNGEVRGIMCVKEGGKKKEKKILGVGVRVDER